MSPGHGLSLFATGLLVVMAVAGAVPTGDVGRSVVGGPESSTTAAGVADAPRDSVHVRAQRVRLDSAVRALDSLRRWCGTSATSPRYLRRVCAIATAAPDRRARAAEDTLLAPANHGHIGYAGRLYYQSDSLYETVPGTDSVTVCEVLEDATGRKRLAYPAIRIHALGDSARFVERRGADRPALAVLCQKAVAREGLVSPLPDSIAVAWFGEWVTWKGRRVWRPFSSVVP